MIIKVNSWVVMLTVLLVWLKLMGYINWSWWWVLAPVWVPLVLIILALSIILLRIYGVK